MANYVYLENNGIITADTSDIKTEVQTEMQAALGADISLEDGTPQGRLIDMETEARVQVAINNAYVSNMWNFNQSSGLALDAWGANFGLEREGAASSRVTATVTGIAGTVISQGSKASTTDGYLFYAENNITIGMIRDSITELKFNIRRSVISQIKDEKLRKNRLRGIEDALESNLKHNKEKEIDYNYGVFELMEFEKENDMYDSNTKLIADSCMKDEKKLTK